MKSFYECEFFTSHWDEKKDFEVQQTELILKERMPNGRYTFNKVDVTYKCSWEKQSDWKIRPTILIPIKDNLDLLEITSNNLNSNGLNDSFNVIIIDDRSTEDIRFCAIDNGFSYLRIDNDKGFNFSMLNNIAAKICKELSIETIVLWNSDLWCASKEFTLELLRRHKENKSNISGSKLIYPPAEMSIRGEADTLNIEKHFSNRKGRWRNTVQFGGDGWILTPKSPIAVSPIHFKRFADINSPFVNCDRGAAFVTGALQMIELDFFISIGGMNPSLSKVFQDVDLCLRTIEGDNSVYYFGKDIYFYHDESASLNNPTSNEKKEDAQYTSDHILFSKIWNNKIGSLVW